MTEINEEIIHDIDLLRSYPRLHAICSIHNISKIRIDNWINSIKYDRGCIDFGFDTFDSIQKGIRYVVFRLEKHSEYWEHELDINDYMKKCICDSSKNYEYQLGYYGFLVGFNHAPILRAMILSENN
ncbi:hypothetical protein D3C74_358230 [compost metagenome]